MSINFPTGTTSVTAELDDKILIADNSDSDRAKDTTVKDIREYVDSLTGGSQIVTGSSWNTIGDDSVAASAAASTTTHSNVIIGGGGQNAGRMNGINHYSSTTTAHSDTFDAANIEPSYSTVIGSYDQINNQQATILASPHSFAPGTTKSGHNAVLGGSWGKVNGEYNALLGGGGYGKKNESEINASRSVILGGQDNLLSDGDSSGIVGGTDNKIASSSSAIVGGDTNETGSDSSRSVILGGQNNYSNSDSTIIGGENNRIEDGTGTPNSDWATAFGKDVSLHSAPTVFAIGGEKIAAAGDTQLLQWASSATITETDISASGCRIANKTVSSGDYIKFNNYGTNIAMTGEVLVTVIAIAGTAAGKANHYKISFGLVTSGTLDSTGWNASAEWDRPLVGALTNNRAGTAIIGDDNLTLGTTNVPSLELHTSGYLIVRAAAAATTATTVRAIASMRMNFTHWS